MRPTGILLLTTFICALATSAPAAELWVVNKAADSVHVLSMDDGRRLAELPTGAGPHEVAVSGDGRLAVVGDYGSREAPGHSLQLYDAVERRHLRELDLGRHTRPHGLAVLPDDRHVAVTTEGSGHLLVVDLESGEIEAAVPTGQEISHMVALGPAGRRAYVANIGSDSLSVIDLARQQRLANIPTGSQAEGVAVAPDGSEVWVTNRAEDTVSVIDADTLEVVASLASEGFPIRATMTGERVLVTNPRSAELAVFERRTRRTIARLDLTRGLDADHAFADTLLGRGPLPIGVVSDGPRAYVAMAGGDHIAVVGLDRLRIIDRWAVGREPDGMAIATGPRARQPR